MVNVDIMPDSSEIVHYDRAGVPLYIRSGMLSAYPDRRALCHWHGDFEFIRVVEGNMRYFIGGRRILLGAGDCLFVNARQLHYGFAADERDCTFVCVLVHPSALCGNGTVYRDHILPLENNAGLPFLRLTVGEPLHSDFLRGLDDVFRCKNEHTAAYELYALSVLQNLVALLCAQVPTPACDHTEEDLRLASYRRMVAFLSARYAEPVSLDEIAGSGAVSKSTCIRIFRDYAQDTPLGFLTAYRLHASCHLLKDTQKSITEIALLCGFGHPSYYAKLFARKYGLTPRDFRERNG